VQFKILSFSSNINRPDLYEGHNHLADYLRPEAIYESEPFEDDFIVQTIDVANFDGRTYLLLGGKDSVIIDNSESKGHENSVQRYSD
jgi:hypothetical protein